MERNLRKLEGGGDLNYGRENEYLGRNRCRGSWGVRVFRGG